MLLIRRYVLYLDLRRQQGNESVLSKLELGAMLTWIISSGESPSSSASDVDSLNNQMTADKSLTSKGKGCHVTGNRIVVARNRPSFIRLFDFVS